MPHHHLMDLQRDYLFYIKTIATKRMMSVAPGMQMMHLRALKFVAMQPGASQQELVEISARDKGQVARISKELQQMGYIQRLTDSEDKRKYNLHITSSGEKALAKIDKLFAEFEQKLVADISQQDQALYKSVLSQLLAKAKTLK